MFNLRLTTKVTFSFNKLNKKLDTLIPQVQKRNLRDVANIFKKNISEGKAGKKPFTKLKHSTTVRRKYRNYNKYYPSIIPQSKTRVLYATGKLHDSIKVVKNGIRFNKYGDYHVKGTSHTPKRNWMAGAVKSPAGATAGRYKGSTILTPKNLKKFRNEIRKGFRLAGRGKNIRDMRF